VPALLALHQVVEALDALLDRDEVREESTEPALIHEVHSGALGFLRDRLLRLLLRSDEEDLPAVRSQVSHEDVRLFDARERLLKVDDVDAVALHEDEDRKSTRLNSSHVAISYAVFCLKKKKKKNN